MTAAILLAGGRATRVGGAAKPLFEVGGATLLQHAVTAVSGCEPVVVVGPRDPSVEGVVWTREDPPFAGPASAIIAGLVASPSAHKPWTYVLECDLPGAVAAVSRLHTARASAAPTVDGICLADSEGRPQWLIGVYRTGVLRRVAGDARDAGRGQSVRSLLSGLRVETVDAPDDETRDVDTWDDLARARAIAIGAPHPRTDRGGETI